MTVKYQGAEVSSGPSGAYTLSNLPIVAPWCGPASVLPIVFAAQVNTTPGTAKDKVEASATGYTA